MIIQPKSGIRPEYYDVDDTLIIYSPKSQQEQTFPKQHFEFEILGEKYDFYAHVHTLHLKYLRRKAKSGMPIVVWSASGALWAEKIVEALGLTEFVDIVMGKPLNVIDDMDPVHWLPQRVYLKKAGCEGGR
jgi:hypothetical protein